MTVRTGVASPAFLEALERYVQNNVLPWHTPGHKQGRGASAALRAALGPVLALDLSDYLEDPAHDHSWDSVLQQAEDRAARVFGAAWTRFLVNGTSGGIHTMLLATLKDGDRVILPRAAHMSVSSGLVLSGAVPEYIPIQFDGKTGLPIPPGPADYAAAFARCPHAKAVIVTYPNYYGMCTDLRGIVAVAKAHNALVLVDEAHGAHYAFHRNLPPSALSCGADIVVQSAHKTLGALTQSSFIHAAAGVDHKAIDRALSYVKTTSRCSLLLASLDAARAQMEEEGERLWSGVMQVAEHARAQINALPEWHCITGDDLQGLVPYWDRCRLVVECKGRSGLAVSRALRRRYGMQSEMADGRYFIDLVGLGDTDVETGRLLNSIRNLDSSDLTEQTTTAVGCPAIPPMRMSPRQANQASQVRVPWTEAVGRISTETICPYPPGIPVIAPGEEITSEVAAYIDWARGQGFTLRGDLGDGCIAVCAD